MTMLFGKSMLLMGDNMVSDEPSVTDKAGSYFRTPTIEEFAKANHLQLDTEDNTSKLGKVGKLSDLDDDDDDWSGGGGFLWSL